MTRLAWRSLALAFSAWLATTSLSIADGLPAFHGLSHQFTLLQPAEVVPRTPLQSIDGKPTFLSDLLGNVVVVNFWATWCKPCAHEMPSLDRLAANANADGISVVAISIDTHGKSAVTTFLERHNLKNISAYLDPDQQVGSTHSRQVAKGALPLYGLPITYILDRRGRAIGYLVGVADWSSKNALTFLRQAAQLPN